MTAAMDRMGRLGRLLNLVPYLLARPGIEIATAAGELGVSPRQLREDLELLWLCGLPGYGPGDLIDMAIDGDRVTITYDAGIDRPLRLVPDEALSLVVALRLLAKTPGMTQRDTAERAIAKIQAAAGAAGAAAGAAVTVGGRPENDRLEDLRRGVELRRALRIVYYTASRETTSERVVDPMRVLVIGGRAYLEAWCREARGVRLFRVDRVDACAETGEPSAVPPEAKPIDVSDGVFQPAPDLPLITLRVGRGARWITEYYPCEILDRESELWTVQVRAVDLAWAARLVLRLGTGVTVVGPPQLVTMVTGHATAALARYGVGG